MRHVDILEEQDSLRTPFFGSLVLHVAVFGGIGIATMLQYGQREAWGEPNALGGSAVGITPVKSIPIPGRTGPVQPLAHDTKSQVPAPAKAEPKKAALKQTPDAIPLKSKKAPERKTPQRAATGRAPQGRELPDHQLTSQAGAAATSPIYSMTPGSGGVGVGSGAPFGTRFGAYALLIRERVAQRWRTDQVDPRLRTLPPAIVTFEILRNGQVRNIRVMQSSGNRALDYSAERAITEASPFEPLPAAYGGNSATIEFWFQLQR